MITAIISIIGMILYFTDLTNIVLIFAAILSILINIANVSMRIQYSLNSITFFGIIGYIVALIFNLNIITTISLFICIECVIMEIGGLILILLFSQISKNME